MEFSRFPLITDPKYPLILGPNISGRMNFFYGELWSNEAVEGCFSAYENGKVKNLNTEWSANPVLEFDASLSNEKYSKNTVQPESSYALIIIKA